MLLSIKKIFILILIIILVGCNSKEYEYGNESGHVDVSDISKLFLHDKPYRSIKVWPYLVPSLDSSSNEMNIHWISTKSLKEPFVEYNIPTLPAKRIFPELQVLNIQNKPHYLYKVKLKDLMPNQQYQYVCYKSNMSFSRGTFFSRKVLKPSNMAFIGTPSSDQDIMTELALSVHQTGPERCFFMGDPSGYEADIEHMLERTFPTHANRYKGALKGTNWMGQIPSYLVSSNTENISSELSEIPGHLSQYYLFDKEGLLGFKPDLYKPRSYIDNDDKTFKELFGKTLLPDWSYVVESGFVKILVLDSHKKIDWSNKKNIDRIEKLLSGSEFPWKIVLFAGKVLNEQDRDYTNFVSQLLPVFEKNGVQLILSSGHKYYFRSKPVRYNYKQNKIENQLNGVTMINIPGGQSAKALLTKSAQVQDAKYIDSSIHSVMILGYLEANDKKITFKAYDTEYNVKDIWGKTK